MLKKPAVSWSKIGAFTFEKKSRYGLLFCFCLSSLLLLSYVNGLVLHASHRTFSSYLIPALVGTGLGLLMIAFLHTEVQQRQQERESFFDMARVLAEALGEKDIYTEGHSKRVTALAMRLGVQLNLSGAELDVLRLSALLHDIGKIGVPDKILRQKECLSDEDWQCLRQHPDSSAYILRDLHGEEAAAIRRNIRHHHERFDGTGYPEGLAGEEIPLLSRIISLADTFDAITSDRPYRKGKSTQAALEEIATYSGTQFDPELCRIFIELFSQE